MTWRHVDTLPEPLADRAETGEVTPITAVRRVTAYG
jgi:hypothetical protein